MHTLSTKHKRTHTHRRALVQTAACLRTYCFSTHRSHIHIHPNCSPPCVVSRPCNLAITTGSRRVWTSCLQRSRAPASRRARLERRRRDIAVAQRVQPLDRLPAPHVHRAARAVHQVAHAPAAPRVAGGVRRGRVQPAAAL